MLVGYTCGVYDIIHEGHIELLKNAKKMCDKLIVGLTTDEQVSYKGKYPIMSYNQRKTVLESIKYVDLVIPQHNHDKFDSWLRLKFDILFVGDDWYNSSQWNIYESKLKEHNVKIVYFPYTRGISTTLIKKHIVHPNNSFLIFNSSILFKDLCSMVSHDYSHFLNLLEKYKFSDDIVRIFNYINYNKLGYVILQDEELNCEVAKLESIFDRMGIDNKNVYHGKLNKESIIEISKLNKISPEFMVLYNCDNNIKHDAESILCYEKKIEGTLKWEDFIDGLYNTK